MSIIKGRFSQFGLGFGFCNFFSCARACYVTSYLVPYSSRGALCEGGNGELVFVEVVRESLWKTLYEFFAYSFDLFRLDFSQTLHSIVVR
jgi:hypothetical protein